MSQFKLPMRTVAAYAGPCIPISGLGLPLALVVAPFYTIVMQVPQAEVGLIFGLVRLIDLLVDPLLGYFMDRTRTRWGRRKPWVTLAVPFILGAVFMLFVPPLENKGDWVYLTIWAIVAYLAYSTIAIAHMSWGAELSPDYKERSRIQGAREFAFVFGMLIVLVLPEIVALIVPEYFGVGPVGFANKVMVMGAFIIIALPITVAIAWRYVPEPPLVEHHGHEDWRAAWRVLRTNRSLQRLLLADLFQGLAPGITAALFIFLITIAYQLPGQEFILLLIYFLSGLAGIPVWIRISYKFSKHRTLAFAMFYSAITLPGIMLITPGDFWMLAAAFAFYGFAYGVAGFLLRAIMADVADEDTAQTGKERAGTYYSLLVMTNKMGYALAPAIAYPVLDMIGFSSAHGAVNSPEAIENFLYIYVFLPMIFLFMTAATMWNFPLDEARQKELRDKIAENRRNRDMTDQPLPLSVNEPQ